MQQAPVAGLLEARPYPRCEPGETAMRRWLDLAVSRDYTSLGASISSRQRAKSTKSQEQQSKERQCGAAAGGNSSKTRTHGLRHFVAYIRGRNWVALLHTPAPQDKSARVLGISKSTDRTGLGHRSRTSWSPSRPLSFSHHGPARARHKRSSTTGSGSLF